MADDIMKLPSVGVGTDAEEEPSVTALLSIYLMVRALLPLN